MPGVDVVVPSYNYARFLRRCCDSILSQQGVDVRILLIDDASTDDTESVASAISRADSRVEYRRHAKNVGHIGTYNEGLLGWARADYSLLISADDLLAPGALSRAVRLLEANPTMGMCYGIAEIVWEDANPAEFRDQPHSTQVISSGDFLQRCFHHGNPVPTPAAIVRTLVQQRIGGYNPALPHSGDMEMWMRFASQGPIGVIGEVQAYYRKHSSSMSVQYYARLLSDWHEVIDACNDFCEKWGAQFPESELWKQQLMARLSHEAFWAAERALADGHAEKQKACLDFAGSVNPSIRASAAWRKMRLKALLGRRVMSLWKALRPAHADHAAAPKAAAAERIGWLPGIPSQDAAV